MLKSLIAIFLGGGIGSSLRYIITLFCKNLLGLSFIGTFIVNMTGCFLIGFIFGLTLYKTDFLPNTIKLFVIVGFLGGLTTFSTFSLEITEFLRNGKILTGMNILLCNCIIGVLLTLFGIYLSKYA